MFDGDEGFCGEWYLFGVNVWNVWIVMGVRFGVGWFVWDYFVGVDECCGLRCC